MKLKFVEEKSTPCRKTEGVGQLILVNLSFIPALIFWAGIVIFLNIQGFLKTKSFWNAINLVVSLLLLIIHVNLKETLPNWFFSVICDMIFLCVSIALFLYINDIETRRKVISEVFENRYQKTDEKKDSK